jgi:hypothetical protein
LGYSREKQMLAKERLERKKYIDVWKWDYKPKSRMMNRIPSSVMRYIHSNSPKRMDAVIDHLWGWLEFSAWVTFRGFVLLGHFLKKKRGFGTRKQVTQYVALCLYLNASSSLVKSSHL